MNVNHLKDKLSGTTPKRIWITSTRLREVDHMAKVKQKNKKFPQQLMEDDHHSLSNFVSLLFFMGSKSRFSKSTFGPCFIEYLLSSSKPLQYQLNKTVLYSLVSWNAQTALAATVLIFLLADQSCSSFYTVNNFSVKVLTFSFHKMQSLDEQQRKTSSLP